MADISAIKTTDRVLEIVHPSTEEPIGVRVTIMSINDARMKGIKAKIQNEKLRLEMRGKGFKADDIEENANALIKAAVTGWEWYNPTGVKGDANFDPEAQATFKGTIPVFNAKNLTDVITTPELYWFAEQISKAIGEEKDFFADSKTI